MENVKKMFCLLFSRFKPLPNTVFFSSFYGLYNDNPKYLSEKLHELFPDIKIVWEHAKRSHEKLPDYVIEAKSNSLKMWYYFSRAKVTVDNGAGYFYYNSENKLSFILNLMKNKRTYNLSTWHGTPLKKIGVDIPNANLNKSNLRTTSNIIFAGSEYEYSIFKNCYANIIPVKKIGNPRNDVLFYADNSKRNALRKKLELPQNCNLLLYCPTYRNNVNDSGIIQLETLDIEKILESMEQKFGGTWKMVFRAHQMVSEKVAFSAKNIFSGNIGDDMAEYLLCCDALLTDYSGSLFDISLCKTPCFLYAHDKNNYIQNERGTYIKIDELPFKFAETSQELIDNILSYTQIDDIKSKEEFIKRIGTYNDGNASKRGAYLIADILFERKSL